MSSLREFAKEFARTLRKEQIKAESLLWEAVRNRRLVGKKFLRQHPIFYDHIGKESFFIADFYSHEHALVIEVDGDIHNRRAAEDEGRSEILESMGIRVLRVRNEEVTCSLPSVLDRIRIALTQPPAPPSLVKRRGMGG